MLPAGLPNPTLAHSSILLFIFWPYLEFNLPKTEDQDGKSTLALALDLLNYVIRAQLINVDDI